MCNGKYSLVLVLLKFSILAEGISLVSILCFKLWIGKVLENIHFRINIKVYY